MLEKIKEKIEEMEKTFEFLPKSKQTKFERETLEIFKEIVKLLENSPREKVTAANTTPKGLKFPSGWEFMIVPDSEAGDEYKPVDPIAAAPLIEVFPDAKVSEHFSLSEFRPGKHSYKYIRVSPALVRALEDIRKKAGEPVIITSSYRPPAYNREVGGVSNSTHIDGLAADIYCDNLSTEKLLEICEEVIGARGGVGYYPKSGFIHVDLRGYEARWTGA